MKLMSKDGLHQKAKSPPSSLNDFFPRREVQVGINWLAAVSTLGAFVAGMSALRDGKELIGAIFLATTLICISLIRR